MGSQTYPGPLLPDRGEPCPSGEHEFGADVYPLRNDGLVYCRKCKWVYDIVENTEDKRAKK